MRKILLLGKDGQVGYELQRSLALLGELTALGRQAESGSIADLSQPDALLALVREVRPDVIVNAAAYTAVDKAESDEAMATQVNATTPGLLAEEAARLGAWLVHYSTDYVFDGSGEQARDEQAATAPLSVYGRSKLAGEERIRASGCQHLIFRTSWVHSGHGGNFVRSILKLAAQREQLNVVADQIGSPTSAELLADITAHALRQTLQQPLQQMQLAGLYHLSAAGHTSWQGFASFIVEQALARGQDLRLRPEAIAAIPSSGYPTPARRPLNSRLDCSKLMHNFDLKLPPWQQGALRTLQQLLGT
nr:dTDP-4-dehydrorhamnose reductase [uncultured Roseateles sp.]